MGPSVTGTQKRDAAPASAVGGWRVSQQGQCDQVPPGRAAGGCKSEIEVSAGLVPPEAVRPGQLQAPLFGMKMAVSPRVS